jgi:hypothetical protein
MALTRGRVSHMNDNAKDFEQSDEGILTFEISDEAIEAAASTITGTAFSVLGAPTVNVLVACCSNDDTSRDQAL